MRSLRARLLAYGLVVAAATIAVLALVVARGTRQEAERFVLAETVLRTGPQPRADGMTAALAQLLRDGGRLADAARVLEPLRAGAPVLVLDSEHHVIAAAGRRLADVTVGAAPEGGIRIEWRSAGVLQVEVLRGLPAPIPAPGGGVAGYVLVLPADEAKALGPDERARRLEGSLGRWLLAAAVCAGGVALGLGLLLARRLSAPIEALTRAAIRLRGGSRGERVSAAAPGEVAELARAFNDLAADLERTEALRRQMVSDVAHELRTPLTRLRGQVEALRDGLLPLDRNAVESLYEESVLLSRLVEDVQQLALADAGSLPLRHTAVDLGELVRAAVAAAGAQAAAAGVALSAESDPDTAMRGDRDRLAQVIGNLIANALAHTSPGGHVRVTARREGSGARLTVGDDGTGISPEHLPHVFERFYRTDTSRARRDGGSGLGLAIVREIAEAHGGSAGIESAPGRGTTVTILLPGETLTER